MRKLNLNIEIIKEQIFKGKSIREIARKLNISSTSIYNYLKKENILGGTRQLKTNFKSNTRVCRECKKEKDLKKFKKTNAKDIDGNEYRNRICRDCQVKKNPEKYKLWNKINKEKQSARQKQLRREPDLRGYFICKGLKKQDNLAHRENNLTPDFVQSSILQGCFYCGEMEIFLMTLDRIDNSIGHIIANVNPSCIRCNSIRSNMPYIIWLEFRPLLTKLRMEGKFENWHGFNKKLIYKEKL